MCIRDSDYSYPAIVKMAERATPFRRFVNPDDPRFANPPSMTEAIKAYCRETGQPEPVEDDEFIRCIFESLAFRYKEVLALLSEMAPFPIRKLHVIGGLSLIHIFRARRKAGQPFREAERLEHRYQRDIRQAFP